MDQAVYQRRQVPAGADQPGSRGRVAEDGGGDGAGVEDTGLAGQVVLVVLLLPRRPVHHQPRHCRSGQVISRN